MATQQQLERRNRELHDYARHIVQLLVTWFMFFCTVNYATMGWIAAKSLTGEASKWIFGLSILFIPQNIEGVIVCIAIRRYLLKVNSEVLGLEELIAPSDHSYTCKSSVPASLYSLTSILMAVAVFCILLSWCVILAISMGSLNLPSNPQ